MRATTKKLKVGDTVQLKTGGQFMTITWIASEKEVWASWPTRSFRNQHFQADALRLVRKKSPRRKK